MPGYVWVSQVPPKLVELLEHDEGLLRVLVLQVVRRADAGDPGPDDQHVEVFRGG